jgi:hypothetical protein
VQRPGPWQELLQQVSQPLRLLPLQLALQEGQNWLQLRPWPRLRLNQLQLVFQKGQDWLQLRL